MLITFCIILIMLISKVWIMDSCLAHASFSLLHTTIEHTAFHFFSCLQPRKSFHCYSNSSSLLVIRTKWKIDEIIIFNVIYTISLSAFVVRNLSTLLFSIVWSESNTLSKEVWLTSHREKSTIKIWLLDSLWVQIFFS